MKQALSNLKVIDLTRSYPPSFAAAYLADFGADVIRIDVPGSALPLPPATPEEVSAYWFMDRNKRALSLDLRSEKGLEIFSKLALESDVIIENSKPGTMEKLGIGYATLSDINPRLIYCSLSGYGQDGPYSMLPGHDGNYLGIAGALSLVGEKDGPPVMPSNLIADMGGAAMHSLAAILIALLARENIGRGQFIDVAYLDSAFSLMAINSALYLLSGIPQRRGEDVSTGSEPFATNYKTKDGHYFNVYCLEPILWKNLCRALDCEEFIAHQWTQDKKKKEEIFSFLKKTFLTKTRDEWWDWAQDKGIAVAPVLHVEEAFNDPQIVHRKMMTEEDHPVLGKVKQLGSPLKLSDTPAKHSRFSPSIGEHTSEILKELGYNNSDIASFKENKVT